MTPMVRYKNLRQYLEAGKMSEKELSTCLGISIAYVNLLKRGERRPSPDLAQKIEKLTGIPFRNLLMGDKPNAA